ncbi:hypothetical protein LCGC14_1340700 [marine sediment metagenome]|uniref:Uncharacterized protein n=1 Tax=marine sediment metagenome TaxID=412755 RepID=A0A0F9NG58_9ZZZZ
MGKGENFERDQCRFLSLWWTEGKHNDVFWRSRVRATRRSPDAKHQLGDIKADSPEGEGLMAVFNIELKTGYSVGKKGKTVKNVPWDLLDLIDYRKGSEDLEKKQIIKFWRQTVTDAEISERIPLLIFKRDFHVPVVCIHDSLMDVFEQHNGRYKYSYLMLYPEYLVLCRAETFFEWLSPETVKMIGEGKRHQEGHIKLSEKEKEAEAKYFEKRAKLYQSGKSLHN